MLFQTQAFLLVFLPLILAGWALLRGRPQAREWGLLCASLVFYGWWDWRFAALLPTVILVNWLVSRLWSRARPPLLLAAAIALNLALLGWFKYAGFLAQSVSAATGLPIGLPDIVLPIGISFFTFQQISYLVDLRGGAPLYPLRRWALYVAFFPQLIAGPIVRHDELIPQLDGIEGRADPWSLRARGAVLFILGMAKKVLIADRLAPHADAAFAAAPGGTLSMAEAWTGLASFTLQIYCDFSAYSDMAIGLGLIFGLVLPLNFDSPYRATSVQDFWRRWHITLSRFFRDYLYIPLGGNRHGRGRELGALMTTMTLCGLWHGAGWTFVLWGAAHGAALSTERLLRPLVVRLPMLVRAPLGWAITLALVTLAWVLFRAPDAASALAYYQALAGAHAAPTSLALAARPEILTAGLVVALAPEPVRLVQRWLRPWRLLALPAALLFVFLLLEVGKGASQEFIYFQF